MAESLFEIIEHVIPCQNVREYPNALRDQNAVLRLAIKEYKPRKEYSQDGGEPGVTIVATHANGFPKETYEPLFIELLNSSTFKIRGIWIADSSHQGQSGVLNEHFQGDDPNWFDHSRDLLSMINHFHTRITLPIFGLGHSMGCAALVNLSTIHPRLIHTIILIEPIIQAVPPAKLNAAAASTYRRDIWPTRSSAEKSISRSPFFSSWDPRALKLYLQYGLRSLPTTLYPKISREYNEGKVTLKTTKHQESWSYVRGNFSPLPSTSSVGNPNSSEAETERLQTPDLHDPSGKYSHSPKMFVRAETFKTLLSLPNLRPSVLYIYGSLSPLPTPSLRAEKLSMTGTGLGGSGGVPAGRVSEKVMDKLGHLPPFENPKRTAREVSNWFDKELSRYKQEAKVLRETKSLKSRNGEMMEVSDTWKEMVKLPSDVLRSSVREKL